MGKGINFTLSNFDSETEKPQMPVAINSGLFVSYPTKLLTYVIQYDLWIVTT